MAIFLLFAHVCTVFELSQKWDSLKGSVLRADTSFGACSKTVETAFKRFTVASQFVEKCLKRVSGGYDESVSKDLFICKVFRLSPDLFYFEVF